jgi:AcrR family transcriptional regulator
MRVLTQNKRREILKAAAAVFAANGFHRSLMDQVAKKAGIGKGTIYRYFPGKEDLYFSILDQAVADLLECLSRDIKGKASPEQKLRRMISDMADLFLNNRNLLKLVHEIEKSELRKRHKKVHSQNHKIIGLISRVIKEGMEAGEFKRGDPKLLAAQIAMMMQVSVMGFPERGKGRLVDGVMETFLHGICKK